MRVLPFILLVVTLAACNTSSTKQKLSNQPQVQRPLGNSTILGYTLGMDLEAMRVHTANLLNEKKIAKRYVFSAQNLPTIDFFLPSSDSLKITTFFLMENGQKLKTLDSKVVRIFPTEEERLNDYAQLLSFFTNLHGPAHEAVDQGSTYKRHTWKGEGTMLMLLFDKTAGVTFRYLLRKK